jgi:hypothetical protein
MKTRSLLLAGALAGPLFVVTFLVEGGTRSGYEPLRHPISSLALGPYGWVQVTNFVAGGLLSVALAAGLWRARATADRPRRVAAGAILVAMWGAAFIGTAVFTTDPVNGYPAGTPDIPAGTANGSLHNLFALVGALCLVAACLVLARGSRPWRSYSWLTALAFVAAFGLSSAGFGQAQGLVNVAGLLQRVAVAAGWAWLTALAVRAQRHANQRLP